MALAPKGIPLHSYRLLMKKVLIALIVLISPAAAAYAQGCSVCTQTASQLGEEGAKGLNMGILYLALLPLTFIGSLGYIWWRYNRNSISRS